VSEAGEPPLVARFLAGGPVSMRGYYTRRLAKMILQDGEWVPVGGNGLVEGNVEVRYDTTGNLGLALFLDAGTVSNASGVPSEWRQLERLQYAAGLGLRYRTPFGPVRLDLGVRLPERIFSGDFPSVPFTQYPDGTPHSEPIVAVHLSLGEAF
jgi:translocation and assembly module TamA